MLSIGFCVHRIRNPGDFSVFTNEEVATAIEANRSAASDALSAIQLLGVPADGEGKPPRPLLAEGLDAAADQFGEPRGSFWVERIAARGLLDAFAYALHARGVEIDLNLATPPGSHIDPSFAARFPKQAVSFRCRITRDGTVLGSGILIGPSTVLTAWHVITSATSYQPDGTIGDVEVLLSDGHVYGASVLSASPCSACEFSARLPLSDNAVADLHDMALLKLAAPIGAALGYASLATEPKPYSRSSPLFLVHYPGGEDHGLGEGVTGRIRKISARVGHTVPSSAGSSGGGCFNTRRELIGIHQGRQPNGSGRYVPLERFAASARLAVRADVAPPTLWSSDNTPDGRLIIGRRTFFDAYAAASGNGNVRGIHVKRAVPDDDPTELNFTYDVLSSLVARDPAARLCRVTQGTLVEDIPSEVVRRVTDSGLSVGALSERQGVASGQSAPEAVGADRGLRAANLVNEAAASAGVVVWLFFDQPAVSFGDEQRSAMEGVIARSLRLANVRIVVAGLEAAAIPGQDYFPGGPLDGLPGLMIDYIRGFSRADVVNSIEAASTAAKQDLGLAGATVLADQAIDGLPTTNGILAASHSSEVARRLAVPIRSLFKENECA